MKERDVVLYDGESQREYIQKLVFYSVMMEIKHSILIQLNQVLGMKQMLCFLVGMDMKQLIT